MVYVNKRVKPVLYYRQVTTGGTFEDQWGVAHRYPKIISYRVTNPQKKVVDSFLYVKNLHKVYGSRYTLIKKKPLL